MPAAGAAASCSGWAWVHRGPHLRVPQARWYRTGCYPAVVQVGGFRFRRDCCLDAAQAWGPDADQGWVLAQRLAWELVRQQAWALALQPAWGLAWAPARGLCLALQLEPLRASQCRGSACRASDRQAWPPVLEPLDSGPVPVLEPTPRAWEPDGAPASGMVSLARLAQRMGRSSRSRAVCGQPAPQSSMTRT